MATTPDIYAWERRARAPRVGSREFLAQASARSTPQPRWLGAPTDADAFLAAQAEALALTQRIKDKGSLNSARDQVNFLKSFVSNPRPNLYAPPANAREAALQKLVQQDVNARDRGFDLGLRQEESNRKRAIENRKLAFEAQDQALQQAQYRRQARGDQQSQRIAAQRLAADQAYRNASLRQRNQAAEDRVYSEDLNRAEEALLSGMDAEEVVELYDLDPVEADQIRSLGGVYASQDQEAYGFLDSLAQNQTRTVARAEEQALRNYIAGGGKPTDDAALAAMSNARDKVIENMGSNSNLFYDQDVNAFKPMTPAPRTPAPAPSRIPMRGVPRGVPSTGLGAGVPRSGGLPVMRTPQEAMRLPSGTPFLDARGVRRIRP